MVGTLTVPVDTSARGSSRVALQPESGSIGTVARYRPSQPVPLGAPGCAVPQISRPSKCDRLEFG